MALASTKKAKQFVVTKQGKYATAGGGYGVRPKVYDTAAAAKYDLDTKAKLRGGVVMPYTAETKAAFNAAADKVNAAASKAPGKAPGPAKVAPAARVKAHATTKAATPTNGAAGKPVTTKSKAKKGKHKAAPKPATTDE